MPALPISNVRQDLFGLVKKVNDDHDPVTVVTKSGENAVLVAESDWNSIMETLYVLQTHGGAQLISSAEDAREGRTEAHALLDPDEGDEDGPAPGLAESSADDHIETVRERISARLRQLFDFTHVAPTAVGEWRVYASASPPDLSKVEGDCYVAIADGPGDPPTHIEAFVYVRSDQYADSDAERHRTGA